MAGSKILFICESPGKLKTLKKILGANFEVEASYGHLRELTNEGFHRWGFQWRDGDESGVDIHFQFRSDRARAIAKKLKEIAKRVDTVMLATDPDREGEAIAWHLYEVLGLKKSKAQRVTFTQITEKAVKAAVNKPRSLDIDLIQAQQARQCLDKMVGFEVSPLLWASTGGKSAGRVQSATLHLICERERERLNFKSEQYWVLETQYDHKPEKFKSVLLPPKENLSEKSSAGATSAHSDKNDANNDRQWRLPSKEKAEEIKTLAEKNPHVVASIDVTDDERRPPAPFITSSLQQVAGAMLKFSPKHTMAVAQELYEGKGQDGLITYMRTDSPTLSEDFIKEARQWLQENAPQCLPAKAPVYKAKGNAQEAHEGIRPTNIELTPEKARQKLSGDQYKLYELIWKCTVASQCVPAKVKKTEVLIGNGTLTWRSDGVVVVDPGFLKFWDNNDQEKLLPQLSVGQVLSVSSIDQFERSTQPPPRYSEPRLIQLMERKGIGRPSTYAATVTTLKDREYVVIEKSFLVPTSLGMQTDAFLSKNLPKLVATEFTATMESDLDLISEGKKPWAKYLKEFYKNDLEPLVAQTKLTIKEMPQAGGAVGAGFGRGQISAETSSQAETSDGSVPRARAAYSPFLQLPPEKQKKLEKAFEKAQKWQMVPICAQGHGALTLRVSKKETMYWACAHPGCQERAWYADLSKEPCPECKTPMEKVPSKKVKGGYFLKCVQKEKHTAGPQPAHEVVCFRNRQSGEWERAHTAGKAAQADLPERKVWQGKTLEVLDRPKVMLDSDMVMSVRKVLSAAARLAALPAFETAQSAQGEGSYAIAPVIMESLVALVLGDAHVYAPDSIPRQWPSFGSLRGWDSSQLKALIRALIDEDLLRFHPSTGGHFLTEAGVNFMKVGGNLGLRDDWQRQGVE